MLCKNLEFVQSANFEFTDSLKNNGITYLLVFDDACEEIWNSKAFVDIAMAGKHRGWTIIYNWYNLFHQSNFGRDVELQNTHFVPFKISPWCDANQHASCSDRSRIKISWLVSQCNVSTLRSFVDWLVATNRWWTTLLHKQWIHWVKILCPWTLEARLIF